MEQFIKNTLLLSMSFLVFSCSNNDDDPYGPDYEINGIKLSVENQEFFKDTIPADVFKIQLSLLSDNDYAHQYGINPRLKNDVTDLQIILENHVDLPEFLNEDLSKYFVVEDGYQYDALYETVDQYVAKKQIVSLHPCLVFTNQSSLSAKANKLISDTVRVELRVKLSLDNKASFSSQLKTVLIP